MKILDKLTFENVFFKFLTVFSVVASTVIWPENNDAAVIIRALCISMIMVILASHELCKVFLATFCSAFIFSLIIYSLANPLGVFEISTQDPATGMSDSQYYLYEAHRFIDSGDSAALFSTWGSLVPVLYGVLALKIFGGNYVGIVFFNSILYSVSVLLGFRLFITKEVDSKYLPLIGIMPFQGFMNGMLAKEPIYLFLIVICAYLTHIIFIKKDSKIYLVIFFFILYLLFIFRPTGVFLVLISVGVMVWNKTSLGKFAISIVLISGTLILLYVGSVYFELPLALFFLDDDGSFSLKMMAASQGELMEIKGVPSIIQPIFEFPNSLILSPLLSIFWLVSPIPLIGNLVNAFYNLMNGIFVFGDLATIAKYCDAMLILGLLTFVTLKRIAWWSTKNPLLIILVVQILNIVTFNFFEASRHRYMPGVILSLLVLAALREKVMWRMKLRYYGNLNG